MCEPERQKTQSLYYTARNGKIQVYMMAYARHVFVDSAQEYGRPLSAAAGAAMSTSRYPST